MADFNKKQIDTLRGNFSSIGRAVGCTREYVIKVLNGEVGNKRGGKKAALIIEKAKELLAVLEPCE